LLTFFPHLQPLSKGKKAKFLALQVFWANLMFSSLRILKLENHIQGLTDKRELKVLFSNFHRQPNTLKIKIPLIMHKIFCNHVITKSQIYPSNTHYFFNDSNVKFSVLGKNPGPWKLSTRFCPEMWKKLFLHGIFDQSTYTFQIFGRLGPLQWPRTSCGPSFNRQKAFFHH
jgi:hypothetical protein